MSLYFAGLSSGIDSDAIIESLMAINRIPLNRLQLRKAEWQAKASAVTDLESRMNSLKSLVEQLSDTSNLRSVTGTSSDTDVLGAFASQGADEATYEVEINQLARAEREVHDGVATLETVLGAGNFVYTYNGVTRTVQTAADATLADLRDLINDDTGNPGVTAYILEYDAGGSEVFHLALSGQDTGEDYSIAIDGGTTLTGFEAGTWTETLQAQNAEIRLDGYPGGDWMARASNTITDVIPNVTLELYTAGTATVTVTRNNGPLTTDIHNLVAIYNGIVDKMGTYTGYDAETETAGILQGDSTLHGVFQQIRSALIGRVAGFDTSEDTFVLAAQIGLEIDKDGRLQLDTDVLADALSQDYMGVLRLIGAAASGGTNSADLQFDSAMDSTQAGVYDIEVDYGAAGEITDARIKLEGEGSWRALNVDGMGLSGQLGQAEQGLELTVLNGGISETIPYQVRVQQGFATATSDRLEEIMSTVDGAYLTKSNQIDSAIDMINKQIDRQEDRLETVEQRLFEKFTRLEVSLAQYEALNTAFESLFQQLVGGND